SAMSGRGARFQLRDSQSLNPGGNWAACASAAARSSRKAGGGTVARSVLTLGADSICAAWLRVMPVTLNNNMPSRHSAELIQCHKCKVFSQPARRDDEAAAEVVSDMRAVTQAGCRSETGNRDQLAQAARDASRAYK